VTPFKPVVVDQALEVAGARDAIGQRRNPPVPAAIFARSQSDRTGLCERPWRDPSTLMQSLDFLGRGRDEDNFFKTTPCAV
jgi:hypothetical protein